MQRRIVWALLLALLVAGGSTGTYLYYRDRRPVLRYTTALVERGALATTVNATGTVNAVVTVQVGSQVSGTIQKLFADFNSPVRADDVIAQIDPAPLETRVNQARAALANAEAGVLVASAAMDNHAAATATSRANADSARANVEKDRVALAEARRLAERNKTLYQKDLIPQQDRDAAMTTFATATSQLQAAMAQQEATDGQLKAALAQERLSAAQRNVALAQVEQARAALQAAALDLEHTTIRSPVDGIVVSRSVDVGQTVAASLQAPTLFLIAQDLTRMQVDTNVSEADIGRIHVDQRATFTVDAYANQTFQGTVTQVRNAPVTVQNVVTYNAVVQVANPELRLKPGMTANVTFLVAERQETLKIPNAALRFQPEGAKPESASQETQAPQARGGAGRGQEMQQQLSRELALTPDQQSRLADILQKSRQGFQALRDAESEEQRRTLRRNLQAQLREQIRSMLTEEQRQKYAAVLQAQTDTAGQSRPGRVWIMGPQGTPEPRTLTLGIANDSQTEVVAGDLTPGQQVITGILAAPSPAPTATAPPGFGGPRRF